MLTLLGGAYSGVYPFAYDYDGTNDYATRGADLTGAADGKQGTFSAWVRVDAGDGTNRFLLSNATTVAGNTNRIIVWMPASNVVRFQGRNAAGTDILVVDSSAYVAGATWRHLLASWDLTDTGKRHIYISDVSDLATVTTYTDDTIDYAVGDWAIGASPGGALPWNGCISELLFHTTYIDLSVTANRRKFITAAGKPANLGSNGALPLGVQPLLYAPTGDASNNKGSGGNFTVTGTLDAASTTPFG